jgi:putative hemolysin
MTHRKSVVYPKFGKRSEKYMLEELHSIYPVYDKDDDDGRGCRS